VHYYNKDILKQEKIVSDDKKISALIESIMKKINSNRPVTKKTFLKRIEPKKPRKNAKAKRMRSNLLWKVKSKKRNQLDSMNKKTQRINKALKSITKSQRKAYLTSYINNSKRK
jgi:hypothetical protein